MDSIKNIVLVLCLFFLIGCLKFGVEKNNLHAFDLNKVIFDQKTYPIVIIGGGIGGLTAAIYCSQANLKTILLEGPRPGGAITMSHSVRNWPGEIEITGKDLAQKIKKQAIENGAQILKEMVVDVDFSQWPYLITTKNLETAESKTIKALSCIIAMGAKPNFLEVPGEREYWGCGVIHCAICDGPLYKDKIVAVVGGGYAAISEANYLSNIAKKVLILVRRDEFRAKGKVVKEVTEKSNVQVLYNTVVKEIKGDGKKITHVIAFDKKENKQKEIQIDGLFLAIGSTPNSKILQNQLELDQNGYIILKKDQETTKKGIFAMGDIANPKFKQAISAAGDGCKAALQAQWFLEKIGYDPAQVKAEIEKVEVTTKEISEAKVIEIEDEEEFKKIVLQSKIPVVVDFYATWCIPCQTMAPIFKKLVQNFEGKVKFVKIDVAKNKNLAQKMEIVSVPTFVFIKDGNTIKRLNGARDFESFKKLVEQTF